MKKIIIAFLVLFGLTNVVQAQYLGAYGQFFVPEDTVRIPITIHDTTGLAVAAWDSASILRYYRGTRVDSLDEASGQVVNLRTGVYEVKFKADKEGSYSNAGEDSIGQYSVVVHAWKQGKSNQKMFTYQTLRGRGLHGLYNLELFLGTPDNCFRVLFPVGAYPKDSVQYKDIRDKDGDGSIETGDTTHIMTVHFRHSNISRVMDSSWVIFHYDDL